MRLHLQGARSEDPCKQMTKQPKCNEIRNCAEQEKRAAAKRCLDWSIEEAEQHDTDKEDDELRARSHGI